MQAESDRLRVRTEHSPRDQQDTLRLKAELEKLEVISTQIVFIILDRDSVILHLLRFSTTKV